MEYLRNQGNSIYEVFRSPENYRYRKEVRIPTVPKYSPSLIEEDRDIVRQEVECNYLVLTLHRAAMHVSEEQLGYHSLALNLRGGGSNLTTDPRRAWVLAFVKKAAGDTYNQLKEECCDGTHNVILYSAQVIWQFGTDRILINLDIYASSYCGADLAKQRFHQALHTLLGNSVELQGHIDDIRAMPGTLTTEELELAVRQLARREDVDWSNIQNITGRIGKKYDDKAEGRALKLLKEMLTPSEFKIYKDSGYVIIESKSKKMYKVKKYGMIEVSKKSTDNLYKAYRLCIEPKNYGTICPTDEVIAKIKLIQADEKKLHKIAKKFEDKPYSSNEEHLY